MNINIVIDNWSLIDDDGRYAFPENPFRVKGISRPHPDVPESTPVTTSRVENIFPMDSLVYTQNSEYTLGDIDPAFSDFLNEYGLFATDYKR